jgi:NAD(P)H-dependent FMN reductase
VDTPCGLLVLWHSRTGAARQLAQSAFDAACGPTPAPDSPLSPRCLEVSRAEAEELRLARAWLFVGPENLGGLSGAMKELLDRAYYALLDQVPSRPYASIVTAGSDGQGATRQLDRILTGWRARRVAPPLIVNLRAQTTAQILAPKTVEAEALAQAAELGQSLQEGVALGLW